MELKFDEEQGKYSIVAEEPADNGTAELEQAGVLGGVARLDVMGLPIGVAGLTAVANYAIDRLLGDRLATWGALGELGIAYVAKNYGRRFLGQQTADAIALLWTYEAVRDIIQSWIAGVWPAGKAPPIAEEQAARQRQPAGMRQLGAAESILGRYGGAF